MPRFALFLIILYFYFYCSLSYVIVGFCQHCFLLCGNSAHSKNVWGILYGYLTYHIFCWLKKHSYGHIFQHKFTTSWGGYNSKQFKQQRLTVFCLRLDWMEFVKTLPQKNSDTSICCCGIDFYYVKKFPYTKLSSGNFTYFFIANSIEKSEFVCVNYDLLWWQIYVSLFCDKSLRGLQSST